MLQRRKISRPNNNIQKQSTRKLARRRPVVGCGPERLEERRLLAADTPLIVETVDLAESGSTRLVGDIRSPDEVDYYRFDVEQSGWLTVGGQPTGSSNFDGPIRLFLFSDANGNDSVEAGELADEFPLETSLVGGTATTYLLSPGTFVVSVSAALDDSHQGEIGAYSLSLARSSVINQLSLAATRIAVLEGASESDSLFESAVANGVQFNNVYEANSETSFRNLLTATLPSIRSLGLSLVVSGSGDLLVVNNSGPETTALAGSSASAGDLPILFSGAQPTNIEPPRQPAILPSAAAANRQTAPVPLPSQSDGRSATRPIDFIRRGHSSQVGLLERALDEMLEAADDVLARAANSLLKPLRETLETLARPLESVMPHSIEQPSSEQHSKLPAKTTSPELPDPEVENLEGDDLESDALEGNDRDSPLGQSSAIGPLGKHPKTVAAHGTLFSAAIAMLARPLRSRRASCADQYQRRLAAVMRRQMAR